MAFAMLQLRSACIILFFTVMYMLICQRQQFSKAVKENIRGQHTTLVRLARPPAASSRLRKDQVLEQQQEEEETVGAEVQFNHHFSLLKEHELECPRDETNVPIWLKKRNGPGSFDTCGVYFFYHVGKTGGTSVREWGIDLASKHHDQMEYLYTFDRKEHDRSVWECTFKRIEKAISSGTLQAENSWMFVHHHHNSPGMHYTMPILREWRETLEAQGCQLVTATLVREPLSRAKSVVSYSNIPKEQFSTVTSSFSGATRYLLYNSCEPRKDTSPPEWCKASPGDNTTGHALIDDEIVEAINYLREEFDIVTTTEDLNNFIFESELLTGWNKEANNTRNEEERNAPITNKSSLNYNWTEEMTDLILPSLHEDQMVWNALFPPQEG